ncbi:MAG: response regulator transcription factor [Lachnospiraceae bacterium]
MANILIVEDDKRLNELVCSNLRLVGHTCKSLFDGLSVFDFLESNQPDLIILDIMLPGMDGFEVLENIRTMNIPVIFLTAKGDLKDRIKGLRLGADDYIVKPFELLELQARVEAVLRRTNKSEKSFAVGNIKVDFEARIVYKNEIQVDCTPKEIDLLEMFIKNRNIALSREKLLDMVWGYDYLGDTRTVDVHIQRLRKKLEMDKYIKTVYKMGYRLEIKNEN